MSEKLILKAKTILLSAVGVLSLAPLSVFANGVCKPITDRVEYVHQFTNYAPVTAPGPMNGNPNTSASGYPAKNFLLEDYLAGRADAVMGAVPQRGGTSHLFGGIYQARALEKGIGTDRCIRVFAGDRYNTKSNYMSKMDIVTHSVRSNLTRQVNLSRGELIPLGRAPKLRQPRRKIQRAPEAVAQVSPIAAFFQKLFGG